VEFNYPGEKLLLKLWETLAVKGMGSLLQPWQIRRVGAASAETKRLGALMAAQTKVDVADIQTGKKVLLSSGEMQEVLTGKGQDQSSPQLPLAAAPKEVVNRNVQNEALRREVSIAKAVLYAEDELAHDPENPKEAPVSGDWLLRWRDNAASISSEELQALWGKVLAGEVKNPGTFSLRTLEFLRNVSHEDARLIEEIAPFAIKDFVVRPPNDANKELGALNFSKLLELQELGILSGVEAFGLTSKIASMEAGRFVCPLTTHGRVILIVHDDATKTLDLPIYVITKLGKQVLQLGWKKVDENYLLSTARRIKELGFDVQVGNYINVSAGKIVCSNLVAV
jgi:hypothetical protein